MSLSERKWATLSANEFAGLRVAVVHDWLTVYGGAERVLKYILTLFPQAELFSMVDFLPTNDRSFLEGRKVETSFIQLLPGARRYYRQYLPLMPVAVEQFDLSRFDLIISSSYAVAKGVITGPDQLHVSYVHSPIRFAWDLQHQYLKQAGMERGVKAAIARAILHRLRLWDGRTGNGVDHFIANSEFIARRIWKVYRRSAQVIYPPVDIRGFRLAQDKGEAYVTVSRLVPYKRVDLLVEAFARMPNRRLVVVGTGPDFAKLQRNAPANVKFAGFLPSSNVRAVIERARAFVFAAEEDFGIVLVEAQACGTPVIAYGKGGAAEIVRDLDDAEPTGILFDEQTPESVIAAIERFEHHSYRITPVECRRNAERFGHARFCAEFAEAVAAQLAERRRGRIAPNPTRTFATPVPAARSASAL